MQMTYLAVLFNEKTVFNHRKNTFLEKSIVQTENNKSNQLKSHQSLKLAVFQRKYFSEPLLRMTSVFLFIFFTFHFALSLVNATDFQELVDGLTNGHTFRWTVTPANCDLISSSGTINQYKASQTLSGEIDNWEYFYDPRFGPQHYFAVSTEQIAFDTAGLDAPYYKLYALRVYQNETATFTVETVAPNPEVWNQTSSARYLCELSKVKEVSFMKKEAKAYRLSTLKELDQALSQGRRVRYVSDYSKCSIDSDLGMGAIGGSNLDSAYEIAYDSDNDQSERAQDRNISEMTWGRKTLIQNYQGEGYVYDVVQGLLSASLNIVNLTASDILTTSYREEYIETFTCSLSADLGAMRFYAQQD